MNNISDYVSHAIQDELDSIMDIIYDDHIKMRLTKIRDSIPCSCGNEEEEGEEEECYKRFTPFKCDKCGHGNYITLEENCSYIKNRCNSCLNIITTTFEEEE